jgi:hypothetical protein
MDDDRALRREAKRHKRRTGMRVHGLAFANVERARAQEGEVRLSRAMREGQRGARRKPAPAR